MNCKDIILKYLKENGYDGLVNTDIECGCGIDDLCPCGEYCDFSKCEAAYYSACIGCMGDRHDDCSLDGKDEHGCYSTIKYQSAAPSANNKENV